VTFVALFGPLFSRVTVNVIVSPTFGVALLTVFVNPRSAGGAATVTVDDAELFAGFGSN
jgi:hypothetical protein